MIAPSGGFGAVGSSGGSGVSVFMFQRTRYAVCGLKRMTSRSATACPERALLRQAQDQRSKGAPPVGELRDLPQRRDVVENPDAAPVRADDEVVVFDDEIADRGRGHVQSQRLPVVAVVERHVDLRFGSGEEQALPLRILADDADGRAARNAGDDLLPRLAAVVGPVDVRVHVVDPQRVDSRVRRQRIETSRIDDEHLHEVGDLRRRDVGPVQAAVGGRVDHAVVGADPDAVDVAIGRPDCVDDLRADGAALAPRHARDVRANALRHVPLLTRQVRADLLPVDAAVDGLPQHVVAVEERARDRPSRRQPAACERCGRTALGRPKRRQARRPHVRFARDRHRTLDRCAGRSA